MSLLLSNTAAASDTEEPVNAVFGLTAALNSLVNVGYRRSGVAFGSITPDLPINGILLDRLTTRAGNPDQLIVRLPAAVGTVFQDHWTTLLMEGTFVDGVGSQLYESSAVFLFTDNVVPGFVEWQYLDNSVESMIDGNTYQCSWIWP